MSEQRNPYKGTPPRPWLRLGFLARDGSKVSLDLLADTGCPYDVVLASDVFARLCFAYTPVVTANFGPMASGWVRLHAPELGLVEFVMGYGSTQLASAVHNDHPDFAGLVGLPVLRLAEYGGDANGFWIRTSS
jgi:hypothetical protein